MSLRRTFTLMIKRASAQGYYDASGKYVEPSNIPPFELKCNIQPYKEGRERVLLPDGVSTEDAEVIYCDVPLNIADPVLNTEADTFDLDGATYTIYKGENRSRRRSPVSHYKYVAIRQDQDTGGGL